MLQSNNQTLTSRKVFVQEARKSLPYFLVTYVCSSNSRRDLLSSNKSSKPESTLLKIISFLILCLFNSTAKAGSLSEAALFLHQLTIAEDAGSLGSSGTFVAVGNSHAKASPALTSQIASYQTPLRIVSKPEINSSIDCRRFYLSHGTPWPLNMGGVFSYSQEGRWTALAAFLNLTVLEGLALPAIAVRATVEEAHGLWFDYSRNYQVAGVASYGFLSYFSVQLSTGLSRGWIQGIKEGEKVFEAFEQVTMGAGLGFNLVPGFVKLSLNTEWKEKILNNYTLKLGARI